jgi:uncharacterized RDD family membrane protein YckC
MSRRLGARLLDWLFLSIVLGVLGIVLLIALGASGSFDGYSERSTPHQDDLALLWGGAWATVAYLLTAGYEIVMIATRGATLGKQIVGIKVVRELDGQVPGFGPSVLRFLVPFAVSLFCSIVVLLVYISPFFDGSGRLQGWHDKAGGTVVIQP